MARVVSSWLHKIRSRQTSSAKTSLVIPPGGSSAWKETFTLSLFFFFPGQVLALGPLSHQSNALALTFIPSLGLRPVLPVFRRAIQEPPGCHHSSNCLLGARTENPSSQGWSRSLFSFVLNCLVSLRPTWATRQPVSKPKPKISLLK